MVASAQTLRRMAHGGTLEVEHLLRAAKYPAPEFADELDALSEEMGWSCDIPEPKPPHPVPFGAWTRVVSAYSRSGFEAVKALRSEPRYFSLLMALVEELHTPEALAFALQIGEDFLKRPSSDPERALQLAGTINMLLSFKPRLQLSEAQEATVRAFLHALARDASTDLVRGTAYCALRYVGNAETLQILRELPPLRDHWASAQEACKRAVSKRIKATRV